MGAKVLRVTSIQQDTLAARLTIILSMYVLLCIKTIKSPFVGCVLNISFGSVQSILTDELRMSHVYAKLTPSVHI